MDVGKSATTILQDATKRMSQVSKGPISQMSDAEFDQWADLLRDRTGMELPVERKSFLETSIGLRMQEIGVKSMDDYRSVLDSGINGELEWKYLIDRLTVHETRFFRHTASLEVIRRYISEKPVDPKTGAVTVQVWSAGCSTGEEAYTLAMTIDQAMAQRPENSYFGIVATDISLPSIKVGRKGIYSARRLQNIETSLKEDYFTPLDDGRYQVIDRIRKRVCFTPLNMLDTSDNTLGKVDIIFCQNVLIYFDKGRRFQIVDGLAEHLNPGGLLILGSGELLNWGHPAMRKLENPDTLAYRWVSANE